MKLTIAAITLSISSSAIASVDYDIVACDFSTGNLVKVDMDTMKSETLVSLGPDAGPEGIAMRQPGEIFVSVTNSSKTKNVLKVTHDGNTWSIESFTDALFGNTGPGLLDFDNLGRLIVAGNSARELFVFDPDTGELIATIEDSGCCNIVGVEVQGDIAYTGEYFQGSIWKADLNDFSTDNVIYDPDRLSNIRGLEVTPWGRIYVASSGNDSIVTYAVSSGTWIETWDAPSGLADLYFDDQSLRMYAASSEGLSSFTLTGTLVGQWSLSGLGDPSSITKWFEMSSSDCNENGTPDDWDIKTGLSEDCNANGVPDECDVADFTSFDCDQNGVPDECQPDCDGDGWIDACDNDPDCDGDGVPDNCETDCNTNGLPDDCEVDWGFAQDCNSNGIPDECDVAIFATATFTFGDTEFDDANNETITLIDTAGTSRTYVIRNDYGADPANALEFNAGAFASVAADNFKFAINSSAGHNGTITVVVDGAQVTMTQVNQGYAGNTTIAHSSGWDALCDVNPPSAFSGGNMSDVDCNGNSIPDSCDLESGNSQDVDGSGIPDECECLADFTNDNAVDINDLLVVIATWGTNGPYGDPNYDGIVDIEDLLVVMAAWGACP